MPQRIQLSRAKGWKMPENTVKVDRTSAWGNPYRLDDNHKPYSHLPYRSRERAQGCVDYYRHMAEGHFVCIPYTKLPRPDVGPDAYSFGAHPAILIAPIELRGKNLACWCDLDMPCHADVLLEWANG